MNSPIGPGSSSEQNSRAASPRPLGRRTEPTEAGGFTGQPRNPAQSSSLLTQHLHRGENEGLRDQNAGQSTVERDSLLPQNDESTGSAAEAGSPGPLENPEQPQREDTQRSREDPHFWHGLVDNGDSPTEAADSSGMVSYALQVLRRLCC